MYVVVVPKTGRFLGRFLLIQLFYYIHLHVHLHTYIYYINYINTLICSFIIEKTALK